MDTGDKRIRGKFDMSVDNTGINLIHKKYQHKFFGQNCSIKIEGDYRDGGIIPLGIIFIFSAGRIIFEFYIQDESGVFKLECDTKIYYLIKNYSNKEIDTPVDDKHFNKLL